MRRRPAPADRPAVVYATTNALDAAEDDLSDLRDCAARLGMGFEVLCCRRPADGAPHLAARLPDDDDGRTPVALVLADFEDPGLGALAAACAAARGGSGVGLHVHVRDAQWRGVFARHAAVLVCSTRDASAGR